MRELFSQIAARKNRIIYSLCFCMFCVIDQRVMTGDSLLGEKAFFRNLTGILMAVLILCQYRKEDLRKLKIPYRIWGIVGAVLGMATVAWGYFKQYNLAVLSVLVLSCFLFGYVILYCVFIVVKEKRYPALNKPLFFAWVVMMVLMVVSRSDYRWPLCYFVMFGCLLLTPFSEEAEQDLYHGLLNGVILSFFAFHAFCCVFRPYDMQRYVGIYSNPNNAALYYLQVLVAVMMKYLHAVQNHMRWFVKTFFWLGLGVVLSVLFMTVGRTSWLVAFVLCFLFLLVLNRLKQKKRFLLNGVLLVLSAVLMFPCTFSIIRYTPPLFHHPVWYDGEWNEAKVHSWDSWDSEKYMDIDEVLDSAVGRLLEIVEEILPSNPLAMTAMAQGVEWNEAERKTPVLTSEEGTDAFLVRKTIYKQYWKDLTLWGRKQSEQGFQLRVGYWIGHAHNIYLQYGVDFGVFVLGLFVGLSVAAVVVLSRGFLKKASLDSLGYLFLMLVPLMFGCLEFCWGPGVLATLMLFMGWSKAIKCVIMK